jgi:hypothetical protein
MGASDHHRLIARKESTPVPSWTDPPPPRRRGDDCLTTMMSGTLLLIILFVTFTLLASCLFGGD